MSQFTATLVIGNSYHVFGRTFLGGTPHEKPITQAEKQYLEETAIHVNKTTDGKRIPECAGDGIEGDHVFVDGGSYWAGPGRCCS